MYETDTEPVMVATKPHVIFPTVQSGKRHKYREKLFRIRQRVEAKRWRRANASTLRQLRIQQERSNRQWYGLTRSFDSEDWEDETAYPIETEPMSLWTYERKRQKIQKKAQQRQRVREALREIQPTLSWREKQVLTRMLLHRANWEIAESLGITESTVRTFEQRILQKLAEKLKDHREKRGTS